MDIIIRTGFLKIDHGIEFRRQTLHKGEDLSTKNHVLSVEEIRRNGISVIIRARVIRQTSISEPPYAVQLFLDPFRNVEHTICNCVSNKSGKCKHVAALIHFVNTFDSRTKTSLEREWGIPSTHEQVKEKYAKGARFEDLFPPPSKKKCIAEPIDPVLSELKKKSALRLCLLESNKEKVDHSMEIFLANAKKGLELELQKLDCVQCVETFFLYLDEYLVYRSNAVLSPELQSFYDSKISLSRTEIIKLACDTIQQSKSDQWFSTRRLRLSASSSVHKIKSRTKKTIDSLIYDLLISKKFTASATTYGIENESKAKELYSTLYKVEVKNVGFITHPSQNWLGASLDGVVIKDGEIINIVEFKCPSSCEHCKVVDYEKKKCNVKYLNFDEGVVSLKKSDPIYTQCQIQMYISGMSSCDLFIYSPIESCLVELQRDEQFLENVVVLCEKFYYDHLLSALKYDFEKKETAKQYTDPSVYDVPVPEP